jgi:hypothetical protein
VSAPLPEKQLRQSAFDLLRSRRPDAGTTKPDAPAPRDGKLAEIFQRKSRQ